MSFLVVGAGLAGCLLAWRLHQMGLRAHLIGDSRRPSASEVAAGVINPVTGRWMTKTWRFDDFQPHAAITYSQLEFDLKGSFYHPLPIFRFCQNAEDRKRLHRRLRNPRYADVLGDFHEPKSGEYPIKNEEGLVELRKTAYVDLPSLLQHLRTRLAQLEIYQDGSFNHAALSRNDRLWSFQGLEAKSVIFCEGAAVVGNPWFKSLPFQPAKGETLLVQSSDLHLPPAVYQMQKWLLAYGDGNFRIGATFDESDLSPRPTTAATKQLTYGVNSGLSQAINFKIKKQLAGIRPCTIDAKPFIGEHPHEKGLYILNGLGSKGASLAPYWVDHLVSHLTKSLPIDPEVDIRRISASF